MKYIFVTGGVISGIGKGVCSSSIGVILKARNIKVTSIKIDPYINIDAGTFSPYEHGEVFVLNDGGEVDLDLGNYERFLDITLTRDNNITTGKIYQTVINRERRGDYLGKTVQVVPHITDEIMQWLERVANRPVENANGDTYMPDVCIVELGGIIGDIESMPYIEAVRQFQTRAHRENVLVVHVSLVPAPRTTGEHKTKPTQRSVHELRGLGLSPDLLFCRSETPLNDSIKQKLSMFCDVPTQRIISVEDVDCLYEVPLVLERQKVANFIIDRFGFTNASNNLPMPSTVDAFAAFQLDDTDTDADTESATPSVNAKGSPHAQNSGKVREQLRNLALTNSAASHHLAAPVNGASLRLGNSASVPNLANSMSLSQPVLQPPNRFLKKWQTIVERYKSGAGNEVRIALVGKYVRLHDAYTSVIAAIEHAGVHAKARVKIEYVNAEDLEPACAVTRASDYHKACLLLEHSHGVLVPGGFDQRGVDGKLAAIRHARERRKPYLGICLGLQCAVIELARNVCQLSDANSAEFNRNTSNPVVIEMPEFNPETKGATMRLGKRRTVFQREYPDSVTKRLYRAVALQSLGERARSAEYVDERHRHRFEVNPVYIERLQKAGMRFVGKDETGERMEIFELSGHPYFVGTQYHPEYQSRPLRPSAPYLGLILAALSAANEQQSAAVGVSMSSEIDASDATLPRELDRFLRKSERKCGQPTYSFTSNATHITKNNPASGTSSGVAVNGDSSSGTSLADSDDVGHELDHPSTSPPESLTVSSETATGLKAGRAGAGAALESH